MTDAIRPTAQLMTRLLRESPGPADLVCTSCTRTAIGNGQEIWLLETDSSDGRAGYVLRRTSLGGPLEWTDRRAEATVMNAVARAGLPVPRVHIARGDNPELGRPYLIMDRVTGESGATARRELRAHIAEQVASRLPAVHRIDAVAALGSSPTVTRADAVRAQLAQWRERYETDRPFAVPMLEALFDDLSAGVPDDDSAACVVWGDPGYHNVLVDEDGDITGLLDWELAHRGHPLEDLGVLVWMETGRVPEDLLVAAYERAGGGPVEPAALRYFVALTCVTRSVMVLTGERSCLDGRTSEPSTLALGTQLLVSSLERAAQSLHWPDPLDPGNVVPDPLLSDRSPRIEGSPAAPAELLPTIGESDAVLARYLLDRVLPHVADTRLVRGIKTAAALLRTTGYREQLTAQVTEQRRTLINALGARLGLDCTPDIADLLSRSRPGQELSDQRDAVRAYLYADLLQQRRLIAPLDELYGARPVSPVRE